jgi:hypothetical protein
MSYFLSYSAIFDRALDLHKKVEESTEDTISPAFQEKVKKGKKQCCGWHLGTDPDPRIRTTDLRIRFRILTFSPMADKMPSLF